MCETALILTKEINMYGMIKDDIKQYILTLGHSIVKSFESFGETRNNIINNNYASYFNGLFEKELYFYLPYYANDNKINLLKIKTINITDIFNLNEDSQDIDIINAFTNLLNTLNNSII